MVLDDVAKEKFRELLARQSAFSQIEIVTFFCFQIIFTLWQDLTGPSPTPSPTPRTTPLAMPAA